MSLAIRSIGWPVWLARISLSASRVLEDFVGLDLDVGDLAADLAVGLVDHHLGVRQGEALALGAAGQEHGAAAGRQADAVGGHRATENLHRVVDGQRGADAAAGRVDVEVDVLAAVLALQVQQLHHQLVGVAVVDLALQEDDAVFQQQIAQRHLPLALVVAIAWADSSVGSERPIES